VSFNKDVRKVVSMSDRVSAAGILGPSDAEEEQPEPTLLLRLRPLEPHDRLVTWDEDVVDNEGLGRKKSKSSSHEVYCVTHIHTLWVCSSLFLCFPLMKSLPPPL
jgi:protein phosphatase inhibitor